MVLLHLPLLSDSVAVPLRLLVGTGQWGAFLWPEKRHGPKVLPTLQHILRQPPHGHCPF